MWVILLGFSWVEPPLQVTTEAYTWEEQTIRVCRDTKLSARLAGALRFGLVSEIL